MTQLFSLSFRNSRPFDNRIRRIPEDATTRRREHVYIHTYTRTAEHRISFQRVFRAVTTCARIHSSATQ